MAGNSGVVAVIVTYRPEHGALLRLLAALNGQVDLVVIVDNGADRTLAGLLAAPPGDIEYIDCGENVGLGAAQNRGIVRARQLNKEFVLLLDQDSEPAADMVERLVTACHHQQESGAAVAAVGPVFFDQQRAMALSFIQRRGVRFVRARCEHEHGLVPVDDLISSGSLIPLASLDVIGMMNEGLFIDYVDTEWIIRARRLGFQSFGVCAAKMRHRLGDATLKLLGRTVTLRTPLRHYYMFRNAFWLYRQREMPIGWKLADIFRLSARFLVYGLYGRPWAAHWAWMIRGAWDGIRGRQGRFSEE